MKYLALLIMITLGCNPNSTQSLNEKTKYVSLTLLNESDVSIPLIIPGYMNPNLSPNSSSGVRVKLGQKVYFKYKFKKRLLLEVSDELEGKSLEISSLLNEKKKELDR